jgi:hypothetical protein
VRENHPESLNPGFRSGSRNDGLLATVSDRGLIVRAATARSADHDKIRPHLITDARSIDSSLSRRMTMSVGWSVVDRSARAAKR